MKFPFEITYRKKIKGEIEEIPTSEILEFAKGDFNDSKADFIQNGKDTIFVENRLFHVDFKPGLNWNRWVGVGSAKFQIIEIGNIRYAFYTFSVTKILILGLIFGIISTIIMDSFWIGLTAFGLIGILNWIIKLLQHWITFIDIFNNLIIEKRLKKYFDSKK
jgi:hypothetical protein